MYRRKSGGCGCKKRSDGALSQSGDFTVREFGEGDSARGYKIVLALDYSGSMRGVLDAMEDGARTFIGMKYPADELAVATFTTSLDVKVPFERDRQRLLATFEQVRRRNFGGYSSVYDGLIGATQAFRYRRNR